MLLRAAAEPKAIAEPGFQFLLLDTYSQLWLLLQQYIADAQKRAGALLLPGPAMSVCPAYARCPCAVAGTQLFSNPLHSAEVLCITATVLSSGGNSTSINHLGALQCAFQGHEPVALLSLAYNCLRCVSVERYCHFSQSHPAAVDHAQCTTQRIKIK